jgi:hypothetical protein
MTFGYLTFRFIQHAVLERSIFINSELSME